MKMKWLQLGFLSAAVLSSRAWSAEQTFSVGNKAAPLSQQGGTARAMGMGSAFVGVAEGSETLLWNPAGLADLCGKEVGLHHTSGLGDSYREIGIFGMSAKSLGGFAASFDGVNNGSFEGRDQFGNQTDNYHAGDLGANLGWGRHITSAFSLGAAVKTNQQYLAGSTYSSYASDLGLLWNPYTTLKLGVAYTNLNIANSYGQYALNSAWHIGTSYRPLQPLLLAISGELQPGGVNRLQFGTEYTVSSIIALRGGYQFNYSNADLSGMTGFTLGVGFKLLEHLGLDYAFVPEGDLGATHRISLIFRFGCDKEHEVLKAAPLSAVPEEKETVVVLQDAHFDFDKSSLTPEAKAMLDSNIKILKENPRTYIRVAGYTSAEGTEEYNQKLSERRAKSVRDYLAQGGVSPDRMSVIGYGDDRPAVNEANPKDINSPAAKANMRTLFKVIIK